MHILTISPNCLQSLGIQSHSASGFFVHCEVSLPADIAMRFAPVGNPKSAVLAYNSGRWAGRRALRLQKISKI